ncbi:cell division protein SepF [Georgenia sp. Z1491]|uniref:cell division protein SepF n=1 Tax=Georgenia sp. Z1491 TaxID=3416707 RepID=UPI003CEDD253
MPGTMRKFMEYLSFAEPQDDLYEGEGGYDEPADRRRDDRRVAEDRRSYDDRREAEETREQPAARERHAEVTHITRLAPARQEAPVDVELSRIVTMRPTSYNDAPAVGDAYRSGTPVILNMEGISEADARRLIDFAAGLAMALGGVLEKVSPGAFILAPRSVAVTHAEEESPRSGFDFARA